MLEMDEAVLQQLVLPGEKVFNRRQAWVRKMKQRASRSIVQMR
jgi:hypothetical protein